MIVCHVVPVVRAIRRAVVARPRTGTIGLAAAAGVRRAARPSVAKLVLVCRDLGALALAGSLAGAAPLPAAPAAAPIGSSPALIQETGGSGAGAGDFGTSGFGGLFAPGGGAGFGSFTPRLGLPPDRLLTNPEAILKITMPHTPPLSGGPRTGEVPPPSPELPNPNRQAPPGPTGPEGGPPVAVSEPSSFGIMAAMLLGMVLIRRHRGRGEAGAKRG